MSGALLLTVAALGGGESNTIVRIAVPDMKLSGDIDANIGTAMTEVLVTEAAKVKGAEVIGTSDIVAVLKLEQQRQLLGCTEASCISEVGGALGVDLLLISNLDQVEGDWVLNLKLVETADARVRGRVNRVVRGEKKAVLVNLRSATRELLLAIAAPPTESPVASVAIWSMIGVGGAAVVTAAILEVLAQREYDQASAHHTIDYVFAQDYELHGPDAQDHFDRASQLSSSALGFAIGGALLASGGVTWLLARSNRDEQLEIRPAFGNGTAGVFLEGSW